MSGEIKVHVVSYKDRTNLVLRYECPVTGKQIAKSARTADLKAAQKAAGKWEDELREGRYAKPTRMTWQSFRAYYVEHRLPALAASSVPTYEATLNVFQRLCNPQRLSDVTTSRVTGFVSELRKQHAAEATIARHLRHLKAEMRWANREGLLNVLPKFTMPKRVKGAKIMRGRPITLEEFERMIGVVAKVVENTAAASWEFYLRGLWDSGLRLSESLTLRWDVAPDSIVIDLSGRRPLFRIPAEAEKGNQDRLLPMTPEFATLLVSVPERERRGRVFKLLAIDGMPLRDGRDTAGKIISAIGEAAGVVVDERLKGKLTVRKFASAHDLRRAFGQRWAGRVMPTVLRELMRHEDISTTMKYYVGQNAEDTADTLWAAVGNISGNTPSSDEKRGAKSTANSSTGERT